GRKRSEHARSAKLVSPHSSDMRYARGNEGFVQQCGTYDGFRIRVVVRRLRRRASHQDRIVAVVDSFNRYNGRRTGFARIVSVKLAEGSFGAFVIRLHPAFQDNFGSRGEGKSRNFPVNDGDGLAENCTHVVVLAHAERDLDSGYA